MEVRNKKWSQEELLGMRRQVLAQWPTGREAEDLKVVALGAMVPQEEFVNAAIETGAKAILVSSLYGMGVLDCEGLRDKFVEAGLAGILLYVGGILTTTKADWQEVERKFKEMGFNRVYPPETLPATAVAHLK